MNQGDGYNSAVGGFSAPENGYYWTHISVGVEPASLSEVYTLGTSRLARLTDGTVNNDVDTLSRDEIFYLGNLCGSMQVCDYSTKMAFNCCKFFYLMVTSPLNMKHLSDICFRCLLAQRR